MEDATARLRKAFKHDDDDPSDDSHDEMDEQEQEQLLTSLRSREAASNARYKLIFTLLPLILILPFLYSLITSPRATGLLSLLAITSLAATAYTMLVAPIPTASSMPAARSPLPPWYMTIDPDGPIATFLPYLNLAICIVLALAAYAVKGRASVGAEVFWILLLLPSVMLAMVSLARQSMAEVEGGLGQLDGLRYGYKGA